MSEITGSCQCGAVRYRVRGEPLGADYCHCSRCRKFSGAPADPGMKVRTSDLELTGREALTIYAADGFADRAFCRTCGSSLFGGQDLFAGETLSVCMGSLDADPELRPTLRKHVASNAPWLPIDPGLPRHAAGCGRRSVQSGLLGAQGLPRPTTDEPDRQTQQQRGGGPHPPLDAGTRPEVPGRGDGGRSSGARGRR